MPAGLTYILPYLCHTNSLALFFNACIPPYFPSVDRVPLPCPIHQVHCVLNPSMLGSFTSLPFNGALTSSFPSFSLLSKPILYLLHQLHGAEAHCAKCHLNSLCAATVIVRTFPLFLSSTIHFSFSLFIKCALRCIISK